MWEGAPERRLEWSARKAPIGERIRLVQGLLWLRLVNGAKAPCVEQCSTRWSDLALEACHAVAV